MAKSKNFTPIQVAPRVFSLIENSSGIELVRYGIHAQAHLMENAELSEAISAAYESYFKNIQNRLSR